MQDQSSSYLSTYHPNINLTKVKLFAEVSVLEHCLGISKITGNNALVQSNVLNDIIIFTGMRY